MLYQISAQKTTRQGSYERSAGGLDGQCGKERSEGGCPAYSPRRIESGGSPTGQRGDDGSETLPRPRTLREADDRPAGAGYAGGPEIADRAGVGDFAHRSADETGRGWDAAHRRSAARAKPVPPPDGTERRGAVRARAQHRGRRSQIPHRGAPPGREVRDHLRPPAGGRIPESVSARDDGQRE